jgi:hypothetical protein
MTTIARSISSKLSAEELAWLKLLVGADLNDQESMQSLVELAGAFADFRNAVGHAGSSPTPLHDLSCSFCGTVPDEVGPVYSRERMAICSVCTAAAVRHFSKIRRGVA